MMRITENLSIPMTTTSPILLSNIDAKDIRQAKSWPSSLVEYVNREGCALGRLGQDHWGTNDERIPRPIAGTPDTGEIQWTREYDVQTYGDLMQVPTSGETPQWRNIPFCEYEPRWWEPIQRIPPRESPQMIRPGIIMRSNFLLNIDYYYGAGVQVCDRQPSVRRVLRPTMKNTLRQD